MYRYGPVNQATLSYVARLARNPLRMSSGRIRISAPPLKPSDAKTIRLDVAAADAIALSTGNCRLSRVGGRRAAKHANTGAIVSNTPADFVRSRLPVFLLTSDFSFAHTSCCASCGWRQPTVAKPRASAH